jgi:hypothetical protein
VTQDEELVQRAIEQSSLVTLQDGRIKSNVKTGRSTIILREIPSDAPEEEVREIFSFSGCKPVTSIRSEIGDTWFVSMESEDDAKDAILDLKVKKILFRGVPVKARLKSETIVKSYFAPPPPVPFMPMPFITYPPADVMGQYAGGYPNNNGESGKASTSSDQNNDSNRDNYSSRGRGRNTNDSSAAGSPDGANKVSGTNQTNRSGNNERRNDNKNSNNNDRRGNGNSNQQQSNRNGGNRVNRGDEKGNNSKNGAKNGRENSSQPVIEINAVNFPPLPADETHQHQNQSAHEAAPSVTSQSAVAAVKSAPISAAASTLSSSAPSYIMPYSSTGNGEPLKKYSIDDIINIVREIREAPLPDTIKPVSIVYDICYCLICYYNNIV